MWGNFDGARDIVASEVLTSTLQRYRVALDEPAAQQPPSLPGHRVQPPLVNACVLLKLLCSNLAAGAIIGREGCNRDVLMAISGARVQLSRPNEFYPATEDRVLVLTGTLPACLTAIFVCAVKLIGGVDKLPIQVLNAGAVTHFKLLLPRRVCGYLIGPGGQTIRAMCVESGAELYVSEVEDDEEGGGGAGGGYRRGRRAPPLEPGLPELEERQLTVRGGIVQCLKGIGLVMHQLLLRPYLEPDAMPFVGQFPHGRLTLTAQTGWVPNPPSGLFQVPSYLVQHLLFNMPHPLQHPTLGQIHLQQPPLQDAPLQHAQQQQQQQQAQGHQQQPQSQPLHYQAASMLAPGAGTPLYPPTASAAAPGARALYYVPFQAASTPFVPLAAAALPTVSQPLPIPPLPSVALGDITAATVPVAAPSPLGMGALGTMLRGEGVSGGGNLPGVGAMPEEPGGPASAPGVPGAPPGVVQPEGGDQYLEVELLVSDSRVGKLLGPRGETLSQLRNIMGCNVQIHPRTAQAFQRRVTISGRASGVRLAQQSILLRLGADCVTVAPQTPAGDGGGGAGEGLVHQAPSLVEAGSGAAGPGVPRGSQGGVPRHGEVGRAGPSGLFHGGAGGRGGGGGGAGGGYRSAGFRAAPQGGEGGVPGRSASPPPGLRESPRGHSGSGSASTRGSRG